MTATQTTDSIPEATRLAYANLPASTRKFHTDRVRRFVRAARRSQAVADTYRAALDAAQEAGRDLSTVPVPPGIKAPSKNAKWAAYDSGYALAAATTTAQRPQNVDDLAGLVGL